MNKALQTSLNWLKAGLIPAAALAWFIGLGVLLSLTGGRFAMTKSDVGLRILLASVWTLVFGLAVSVLTAPPGRRWRRARAILLASTGAGLFVAGLAGVFSLVDGFTFEFAAAVAFTISVLAVGMVVYRVVVSLRTTTGRFDVEVTAAPAEAWTALAEERPLFNSGSARIELGDHGATRLGETLSRADAETLVEMLRHHGGEGRVVSIDQPRSLRLR